METLTSVGVTHSISLVVVYFTRYWRNGVFSRTSVSDWFPGSK